MSDSNGVRYTVKELIAEMRGEMRLELAEIKGELRAVTTAFSSKVEREEHEHLRARVEILESEKAERTGETKYKRWVIPLSFIGLGAFIAFLSQLYNISSGSGVGP